MIEHLLHEALDELLTNIKTHPEMTNDLRQTATTIDTLMRHLGEEFIKKVNQGDPEAIELVRKTFVNLFGQMVKQTIEMIKGEMK